jgi:hypothetical protein
MKLSKLFTTCTMALCLALPMTACDSGDDEGDSSSDSAGDNADENADETTGAEDVSCDAFCTSFVDLCIQTGESTEFETNDQCLEACGAWDQAGINCRHTQIADGMCSEAGNMGTACN